MMKHHSKKAARNITVFEEDGTECIVFGNLRADIAELNNLKRILSEDTKLMQNEEFKSFCIKQLGLQKKAMKEYYGFFSKRSFIIATSHLTNTMKFKGVL